MSKSAVVFFALLGAVPAVFATGAKATLSVSPTKIVSGVPASLTVTIQNDSFSAASIPSGIWMYIETPDGGFYSSRDMRRSADDVNVVQPRSSLTLEFPDDGTLFGPDVFLDERITVPGEYRLTLVFSGPDPRSVGDPSAIPLRSGVLVTNRVPVTVVRLPKDEGACALARSTAGGTTISNACPAWTLFGSDSALTELWTQYPSSTFAQYLALSVPGTIDERIARLRSVVAANLNTSFGDWQRLKLARFEEYAYVQARNAGKLNEAESHAAAATELYNELTNNGSSAAIRQRADEFREIFAGYRHGPTR